MKYVIIHNGFKQNLFSPNAWTQVESSFIFWCSPILFFIHMVGCIHPSSSVKYEGSIYNEPDLLSKRSLLKSSNIWTAKVEGREEQRLKASHQKKVKYCKWRDKKWGKAIGPNISVWSNYACELTKQWSNHATKRRTVSLSLKGRRNFYRHKIASDTALVDANAPCAMGLQ